MNRIPLLAPMLDNGIRNTNFFNGRLLTAEDLQTFQQANGDQHGLLGRAIGDGVVSGFTVSLVADGSVSSDAPVVQLSPGLAVNRRGRALVLPSQTQVQLALTTTTAPPDPSTFNDCGLGGSTTFVPGITGASILVVSPASGFQDQAPMHSIDSCGCTTGCGSKYAVDGVKFRLVSLPSLPEDFPTNPSLQRNYLAHFCFGTPTLAPFPADPLHAPAKYGAVDSLRDSGGLTDCDVPLALIYWTQTGVQFVDNWSVRRRAFPLLGEGADNPWPMNAGQRRLAEAEATFYQFQDHLADIFASQADLSKISAVDYFKYLPAGGFVPLSIRIRRFTFFSLETNIFPGRLFPPGLPLATKGFNETAFFANLNVEDAPLDVAFIRWIVEQSWYLEPIDLTATPQPLIRIYKTGTQPQWLLFLRQENRPVAPPKPGAIEVILNFSLREAERINVLQGAEVGAFVGPESFPLTIFEGTLEKRMIIPPQQAGNETGTMVVTFRIGHLQANTYTVFVSVPNFTATQTPPPSTPTQPPSVVVNAGATSQISFTMTSGQLL